MADSLLNKSRKVLFTITSMTSGGAERVCCHLANALASKGYDVTVLTFKDRSFDFYSLSDHVHREVLPGYDRGGSVLTKLRRHVTNFLFLRRFIRNSAPDIVIPFMDFPALYSLVACLGLRNRPPVAIALRNDMRHQKVPGLWVKGRKLLFPKADHIISQTESLADYLRAEAFPSVPVTVINNPLGGHFVGLPERAAESFGTRTIVSVARLMPQKGLDLLIKAFARVHSAFPQWKLNIVGEGEQRAELETLINQLNLEGAVMLAGRQQDVSEWYNNADFFVLPSHYEGFPNVLIEAMAHGIPVLATDCLSGPGEIITPGKTGLLCEPGNTESIAQGLQQLIEQSEQLPQMGRDAQRAVQQYAPEKIIVQWEQLIERTVQ